MEPLTGITEYKMRVLQATGNARLRDELTALLGDKFAEYAQTYGWGGPLSSPYLDSQAARAAGLQEPPAFVVDAYAKAGYGTVVDGKFKWGPSFTSPFTGYPEL